LVLLVANQTLPQLRSHIAAALNVGVSPIEIREAVYQCAPFVGFPKTLNGVAVINEVFADRGITLPLADQATVAAEERFARGQAIQHPLNGDAIRDNLAGLSEDLRDVVPRLLTEFCFGDFAPEPAWTSPSASCWCCACWRPSAAPTCSCVDMRQGI
jgi:4-carboxymuconolactone decarboxylase